MRLSCLRGAQGADAFHFVQRNWRSLACDTFCTSPRRLYKSLSRRTRASTRRRRTNFGPSLAPSHSISLMLSQAHHALPTYSRIHPHPSTLLRHRPSSIQTHLPPHRARSRSRLGPFPFPPPRSTLADGERRRRRRSRCTLLCRHFCRNRRRSARRGRSRGGSRRRRASCF